MKLIITILLAILIINPLQSQELRYSRKENFKKQFSSRFNDFEAVFLVDLNRMEILFDHKGFEVFEIASLTKMMPTLLVVEEIRRGNLSLDDTLRASTAASKIGGSQIFLREFERMRVDDLLKSVVIKSANDATTVLGEEIGGEGKLPLFIKMMNSRAQQLGMNNTSFYFPHGLPPSAKNIKNNKEANTSTCYDLVLLAEEMLKHSLITEYSSIWLDYIRKDTKPFMLRNTSRLIKDYPYFDGLKTGYYRAAGFNIVATAKKDNMRLVAVVLGTRNMRGRDKFVNDLVTWGFSELEEEHSASYAGEEAR